MGTKGYDFKYEKADIFPKFRKCYHLGSKGSYKKELTHNH